MNNSATARLRGPATARRGVTLWDPSSVFLIKTLLYPSVATGCLGLALWICGAPFQHEYFLLAVLAFIATAEVLDTAPLQYSHPSRLHSGLAPITVQWFIVVGFIWTLLTLSGFTDHFEPKVVLTWAGITPAALWLSRLGAQFMLQLICTRHMAPRNAVIIGRNKLGALLERRMREDSSLRIRVLGYFDDLAADHGADEPAALLGEPPQLAAFIVRHSVRLVYVTWPMTRESRILDLLESLRDSTVSIYFVPDVSVASLIQGRVDLINGIPVVGICESPFYGLRGMAKRVSDIIIAGTAAIIAAPVLFLVAVAVRATSPGPVIFKQRRYGLDGREIIVYKFRSMTVTEDGDHTYTQVIRNDTRVTRLGAFLRASSLDELPQLFNVLEGSMSLVGPRPHAIAVNEQYRGLISGYMVRHKVKPGVTGWAQVNGLRGGDDLDSMRRRVEFDLEYLRNWSFGLDIAILLRTVTVLWSGRQAF